MSSIVGCSGGIAFDLPAGTWAISSCHHQLRGQYFYYFISFFCFWGCPVPFVPPVNTPLFPSHHLHHDSFSNPSLALPTSQDILQPFFCFTYITAHPPTLLSHLLRHRIFTYGTWRAAHGAERFLRWT